MNASRMMIDMVMEPTRAFGAVLERPRAWWPLLAVVGGSALVYLLYFLTVDFDWFIQHTLNANPDLGDDQREAARSVLQPATMTLTTVLATLLAPTFMFALFALYYLLASQALGHRITYGRWYAFCVWSAVPRLIVFPLMLYQIASSHGQVALEDLSMVSINYLWLHLRGDQPWAGLANALDLTFVWSLVISVIGFRAWTGESWLTSAFVNAIPSVAIYGLWALRITLAH